MAEESRRPETALNASQPPASLTRTSPRVAAHPEERFLDVKTDPYLGWAHTLPLVEKYWDLAHAGVLREDQLLAAVRAADRAGVDVEDVLAYSYRVAPVQIGTALSKFYDCPYEPFQADRKRPEPLFVDHPKYEYLLREGYVPLKELQDGTAVVLALNPTARPGGRLLGKRSIAYAVTTRNEFFDTLRSFFGRQEPVTMTPRTEHWSSEEINTMILEAWRRGCSDIHDPLDRIELSRENLAALNAAITQPHGLFLVCGPTGSGKTTTLHAILHRLNEPGTKIWTAEDPVEISHEGLCQVQINAEHGITFATALRTFLRSDPDVIMVGEMRDRETASIAIEASLTGHLVLSTLHTNTAPETLTRLIEMGIDPFLIADALLGVLSQRLTKRLCLKCRRPRHAPVDEISSLLSEYAADMERSPAWMQDPRAAESALREDWTKRFADASGAITLFEAGRCEECSGTGYDGRIALHELLVLNEEIKRAVQERARSSDIYELALNAGMRTLRQDGILKVLGGHTELKQVHAVCVR